MLTLNHRYITIAIAYFLLAGSASAESQPDRVKPRGFQQHFANQQQVSSDIVKPMIVGGREAEEGVHPFQVGLMRAWLDDNFQAQFCGGTLVADRFVVTAAHCIFDFTDPLGDIDVLVGTQALDGETGQRIGLARTFIHPGYNDDTWDYDVAVLELSRPVSGIDFASIANTAPTAPGTVLRTTGWGILDSVPKPEWPRTLQQVDVPFVPASGGRCGGLAGVTSRMICAGEAGKDSCSNDSGGPLTINRSGGFTELVGIVSWGDGCAKPNSPGVYTNVAQDEIYRFIQNIMAQRPTTIQFQITERTVGEGAGRVTLTVERTSAAGTATVRYATVNRSAAARSDFRATSGTLTFRPGQWRQSISVPVLNDRRREGAETFSVVLSRPSSGWTLGSSTAVVTINDND